MQCKHCGSSSLIKKNSYRTKTGLVKRYLCKACGKWQSKRTFTENYRFRKAKLTKAVTEHYCERMSLRGMARVMKVNRKTVVRHFLKAAKAAEVANLKALENRDFVTSYIQFDEVETFEHTKRKPLAIQLFIRAKTGHILAAKVGRGIVKSQSVSPAYSKAYNAKSDRPEAAAAGLMQACKVANRAKTTLACDGSKLLLGAARNVCRESFYDVQVMHQEHKAIDAAIAKLRNDVSRLSRKTLCTTKKADRLQSHLDLYTNYSNKNRVPQD